MLSIGITGGIGSGKSTVCKVFNILGIPVFQADFVAMKLQNENQGIISGLKRLFGSDIYTNEKQLNRKKLASIIFNNKSLLNEVNQLIHPTVHLEFDRWKDAQKDVPYIVYEAAVLFETGRYRSFDCSILVLADEKERVERILRRDQITREEIEHRMRNQMSDIEKRNFADFIIENNDNQMIIPQILKLDTQLKLKNHVW